MNKVGIDSIAFSIPSTYLDLRDLATARGVAPEKYEKGLGVSRMAIAGPEDDAVTLATNAARRLLAASGRQPDEIGYCAVGTETGVDHSKPVASYVHGLLGLAARCRVFEVKHACFGATAGLLGAAEWIAAGSARGRAALVIATDVARYELGSAGEPTQGAGAVAMLVSEAPRLVELEVGRSGSYARDVHDFWRPLPRKDALVDGHYSVSCYLDALGGAYADWKAVTADDRGPLARTVYHVPYGKMAAKAHRRRYLEDGRDETAADASFAVEVAPSLKFPSQVGNVYTGSLYLALASLLHHDAAVLEGQRVGLFSYGSGCGAEFFAGRVAAAAGAVVAGLDLAAPLADQRRRRLTIPEYEAVRRAESAGEPRANGARPDPSPALDSRAVFVGIDDEERRVYAS